MDRLDEIEAAIVNLPPEEYRGPVDWFRELGQTRWDDRIDRGSADGKLDFLFNEAQEESIAGWLHCWLAACQKC